MVLVFLIRTDNLIEGVGFRDTRICINPPLQSRAIDIYFTIHSPYSLTIGKLGCRS
jgi:hypothetical protein